jgi:hypothetical protein
MKQLMSISANLYEPVLLKNVVEKLASRHVDMGISQNSVPRQWKAIVSSCIQATVSGCFDRQKKDEPEEPGIAFESCFLFTCIKGNNGLFNLEWSTSLS